ncbi:hypothetical protein D3C85_1552900 [compost metagenome]
MAVSVFRVGGIHGKCFGEEQQVGSLGQSISNGNATTDMEQRLVRAVDEGREADGFQF